jgi:hypothetical protein
VYVVCCVDMLLRRADHSLRVVLLCVCVCLIAGDIETSNKKADQARVWAVAPQEVLLLTSDK